MFIFHLKQAVHSLVLKVIVFKICNEGFYSCGQNTKYPNGVSHVKQSRENCEINKSKFDVNKSHFLEVLKNEIYNKKIPEN